MGENQSEKRILDIINEQFKNLTGGDSIEQILSDTGGTTDNCGIKALADNALYINNLRLELDRLQLDFKARLYFENDIKPLIDTLTVLSFASNNYSNTARNLASINFGRTSKIKDTLDLTESVDDISSDLIKVLKCKIDNMIKLSKWDCK